MRSVILGGMILALLCTTTVGQVHFHSELRSFIDTVEPTYVLFATQGQAYDEDSGTWETKWKLCTTATLWANEQYAYGVVARHCYEGSTTFRPEGSYLVRWLGETSEKLPATVLDYVPAAEHSEVRLWRAPNEWGFPPRETELYTEWKAGDAVFACGFWDTLVGYSTLCDTGFIKADPGPVYLGYFSNEPLGDIAISIPSFWGFSGGPVFVYDGQKFMLVGIINGFSVFSSITFAWAVDNTVRVYLEREFRTPEPTPPVQGPQKPPITMDHFPQNFQDWDMEDQRAWRLYLEENATYNIFYDNGFVLAVGAHTYLMPDSLAVSMALINNAIDVKGSMLSVKWSQFVIIPKK